METVATTAAAREPDEGELSPSPPQDSTEMSLLCRLPVCSQQQGEPDLTEQEKVAILGQLYHEKPLVFLERFRTSLREEHLACFGHLRGDHRADFYCAEVARQGSARPRTLRTRLRNRRYAALRELIQGGQHFSDEQMRLRVRPPPLLAPSAQALPASPASLPPAPLLLKGTKESSLTSRPLLMVSAPTDPSPGKDSEAWVPDSEERLILREEFTSRMHQHFLDGKDGDFDYSTVADNPDFDNLDIVARDEEERYFDAEEPEEAPSPELDGD
uniref:Coiled-coil domain containing 97 n=1 Tax=Panthera tigris altaica TaxID=74533 RepID=A0A8C9K2Q7_PANTA